MQQLSKSLCGRSLRVLPLLMVLTLGLSSCSAVPLVSSLAGGPKVAANVQAGKENRQAVIDQTHRNEITTGAGSTVSTKSGSVSADKVDTVNVQQTPVWMIVLLVLGWLLPSPNEIGRIVRSWFKKTA